MANRPISDLDFQTIKQNLKDYLRTNPTFTDYDFEGSTLNVLLDLLAYNTHYNGYYTNMLHNEGFLDTAQKRQSVVSRAKELGYTPRSAVAATAFVDVQLVNLPQSNTPITLPRGTVFTSSNGEDNLTFTVVDTVSLSKEEGGNFFRNVKLKEGTTVVNSYFVENSDTKKQIFTIPNADIDTTTLRVVVRDTLSSSVSTQFNLCESVVDVGPDDNVYFLQESFTGLYEFYFGDGVLGKKLENGNVIEIEYIVTSKEVGNGCKTFNLGTRIAGESSSICITKQKALGGKDKEQIEDIKNSAIKKNAARNRAVTSNDYEVLLKERLQFVKSVSVWGGEENVPPIYGKVFVSLQPEDGYIFTQDIKNSVIIPTIKKLSMVTITPEIVDPKYTFVSINSKIKFNKNATKFTADAVRAIIIETINTYFNENISVFGNDFYSSQLSKKIYEANSGIVSVTLDVRNSFKINPTVGVPRHFDVVEGNRVVKNSVTTSKFNAIIGATERICKIVDNPNKVITTKDIKGNDRLYGTLELVDYNTGEYYTDVGSIEYSTVAANESGRFQFDIVVSSLINNRNDIFIYYKTEDSDILSHRNQILTLDTNAYDETAGTLAGLDVIITDYEK